MGISVEVRGGRFESKKDAKDSSKILGGVSSEWRS